MRKERNAYFSVEAALVLPLVAGGLLLGVYLFCFQYDRCLLEQDVGSLLVYGQAASMENGGETEALDNALHRRTQSLYWEKYAAWEMEELDIRLEKNQFRVTGQGKLNFPVPQWNIWKADNSFRARADYKARRLSPVYEIRQYRKLQRGQSASTSAETE